MLFDGLSEESRLSYSQKVKASVTMPAKNMFPWRPVSVKHNYMEKLMKQIQKFKMKSQKKNIFRLDQIRLDFRLKLHFRKHVCKWIER